MEERRGYVSHIVYRNVENGYTVFELENPDEDVETIISNIIARIAEIYEKEKDINRSLEWCRKAFRNSVNNKELQEEIEEKIEKLSKLA